MSKRDPVILQIGSQMHQGWQEVRIRMSLEQIADEFELSLTEKWGRGKARPVSPGEACTVSVGTDLVVTGYVDMVLPDYDAESHTITVRGRSKTADLVDCSGPDQRFTNRTLAQIAAKLAGPLSVSVVDEAGAGKAFSGFTVEDGQPFAEALERAAQIRGVRLATNADGDLVIADTIRRRVGAVLELGRNIRKGSGEFSDRDRFCTYVVAGQTQGTDQWFGEKASAPRASAKDPRVRPARQTMIVADTPADKADCRQRAELEARIRWARSRGVTYTVGFWRHGGGVWRPGDLVHVKDPYLGLDKPLLVSDVQLIENEDEGRAAEIRVSPPEAFEMVPVPEPETDDSQGWGW